MLKTITRLVSATFLSITLASCGAAKNIISAPLRWGSGLFNTASNVVSQNDAPSTSSAAIAQRGKSIQQRGDFGPTLSDKSEAQPATAHR